MMNWYSSRFATQVCHGKGIYLPQAMLKLACQRRPERLGPLLNASQVLVVKTSSVVPFDPRKHIPARQAHVSGDVVSLSRGRADSGCCSRLLPQNEEIFDVAAGCSVLCSHDVPCIFGGVAELAAGYAGRQGEVADRNLLVDKRVREVISTLSHGTHEDADALLRVQSLDIVSNADKRCVETERDLAAIRGKMLRDGALDNTEQLLV